MKNEEFATALGGFNKESIMRNKIFNMGKRSMKMTMKLGNILIVKMLL